MISDVMEVSRVFHADFNYINQLFVIDELKKFN